ncbi:hypothetical protein WA026_003385 [Henosepilachna vigintioctopunctata]|uniref:Farnesol dehydrogenase-like n=1 Tax=Henosepilachna vigintioctopunctata TaxID=420089 RepID=A0AAW1TM06_9CUCU
MVLSMEKWKGKIAVVTGASAGIGVAIVEHLVDHGLKVIGLARRKERLTDLEKRLSGKAGSFHGLKVDIGVSDEVIAAFEKIEKDFGPVHILVNNAGVVYNTTIMDGNIEQWKSIFDINVIGLCVATKLAIASMRKHNIDGHIVHINSTSGHRIPVFLGTNVYPASKHAVTALTECLRLELVDAKSKIKVSSVSPGPTDTEIFEVSGWHGLTTRGSPFLKPEDIADAVVFVLSTPPHVQVHDMIVKPVGAGP